MARRPVSRVVAPEQRIGFLIYRVGMAVTQAYELHTRPSGLAPGEIGVLTQLASHGPGHVREVGRALGVSPQTVVNLARTLETKNMVQRASSSTDRRTVVLDITERGREALAQADEIARGFDQAIETLLGEDAPVVVRALRLLLEQQSFGKERAVG